MAAMAARKLKLAEKRFACDFNGCGRSFTRQEHLQRHVLNHADGDHTCERCRAHFKRRDLLERHLARHQQKDAEGSSLMTRKRMWKDENGNIVTKRPMLDSRASSIGSRSGSERGDSKPAHPMSPPNSLSTTGSNGHLADMQAHEAVRVANDPWMFVPEDMDLLQDNFGPLQPSEGFWESATRPTPELRAPQDSAPEPYEDVFNPDTASSFNMPFTTMNNYNWLFDINLSTSQQFTGENMLMDNFAQPQISQGSEPGTTHADPNTLTMSFDHLPSFDTSPVFPSTGSPEVQRAHAVTPQTMPLQTPVSEAPPEVAMCPSSVSASSYTGRRTSSSRMDASTEGTSISSMRDNPKATTPLSAAASEEANIERPMTLLDQSSSLPKIDEIARAQVLDLVEISQPVTPDGYYITPDHPLLSLASLQTYSDLYFSRFNAAYPLIHQATFEASQCETLLLTSILLLGATYCEKDAHQLAVCIHDVLRPQIFANAGFSARPELWVLQTILLVECFGKSRAGQKQHDMSHLFHGLLINLIRRSDCQTARPETLQGGTTDLEDEWREWAEMEQKKRLALLCFMWDTQHAVLFCQSLCMSAFELRSSLPCDQSLWEATSAGQWQKLRQKQSQPPLLLTVLKSYLSHETHPATRNLNGLSRVILLHALLSISWDMKRRDQTSLGLMGNDTILGDWRQRMATAYDTWKADFDAYSAAMSVSLSVAPPSTSADQHAQTRKEFAIFTTANTAIYHAAHVILYAEFLDLQIYAGARHILGRPVSRADYRRSQAVVKRWANDDSLSAAKAAWHAAHLIKDAATNLEDFDAGGLFHYPWCLYLATVTCWSLYHARPVGAAEQHHDEDDEMIWDAKAEMNALIGSMTSVSPQQLAASLASGGKRTRTAGLTAVVAKHLSKVRWAVVHDGMLVLRGLVPWRLINQDETLV